MPRINELPEEATPAWDDQIPLYDASERKTNKVTVQKLAVGMDAVQSSDIRHIVKLTQSEYDALTPPAEDTLYVIVG